MPQPALEFGFDQGHARGTAALFASPHWYACHTRSRHEKKVNELLCRQGIESYLPLVTRESRWKDRTKRLEWPLFPGYVFCRFTLARLSQVLCTRGLAGVVGVNGSPTPIPAAEMENVRLLVHGIGATQAEPEPRPMVHRGDWVRVQEGPFRGLEGVVMETRGRRRLLVGITAIGQALEVDAAVAALVPIPAPR